MTSPPRSPPLLELVHVSKIFRNGDTAIQALNNVSLAINQGEFVAILGQSGSGKSTLMHILGCLDTPSSGSYKVSGRETATLSPDTLATLRRETFGFVFQRYNLLSTDTARENVEMPAIYAGIPKEARVIRSHQLLQRLGLGDRTTHPPSKLSGGQQQRVAIARALMNNPLVILADEPTGALDSQSGKEVMDLLKGLHQEGTTIILITHDQHVANHANRRIHLYDGKIQEGSGTSFSSTSPPISLATRKPASSSANGQWPIIMEAIIMAIRALRVNMFRTGLTLLGIIIGVASVITMLAIGNGSKQKILAQISAMGTDLLVIRPGAPGIRGGGDIITLVPEDADAINRLDNIAMAIPERSGRFTVRYGNLDYQTTIQGVGDGFPMARNWATTEGQFFDKRDVTGYAPVVVLGQTVLKNLFPDGDSPIGKFILVQNVPFQVIGTMAKRGASPGGNDQDDVTFIPITTGMIRLFGKNYLSSITVKVATPEAIFTTQETITSLLKERHRTEDFSVRNMAFFMETATATQNTLTVLLGTVAAISLLVGGIGVMNIMLVSVTERTREIGIRMATGARQQDIALQFNIEALMVCALGGILGIGLGLLTGGILKLSGMSVIFTLFPALLAFICAFLTGLVFGYLPARKAARLDPVIALASE